MIVRPPFAGGRDDMATDEPHAATRSTFLANRSITLCGGYEMSESDGGGPAEPLLARSAPDQSAPTGAELGYASSALFCDLIPSSCRAIDGRATIALGDWALVRDLLQPWLESPCSICDVDGPARVREATLTPCEDARQLMPGPSIPLATSTPGGEAL